MEKILFFAALRLCVSQIAVPAYGTGFLLSLPAKFRYNINGLPNGY